VSYKRVSLGPQPWKQKNVSIGLQQVSFEIHLFVKDTDKTHSAVLEYSEEDVNHWQDLTLYFAPNDNPAFPSR
jgi:hypothetical protein